MSMYKDYVENQLPNRFVHETKEGFLTYHFNDKICRLEEIYIKPEERRKGIASLFYKKAEEFAQERNCDYLIGSIIPNTEGAEGSMMCLLKNGFKLDSMDQSMIYLSKSIGD